MLKYLAGVVVIILIGLTTFFYLQKTPAEKNKPNLTPIEEQVIEFTPVTNALVGSIEKEKIGKYLTDTKGMALYVNSIDNKEKNTCTGECLKKWPIFEYDSKNLTSFTDVLSKRMNVIKRTDNIYQQYAYGDKPLYYYIEDKKV